MCLLLPLLLHCGCYIDDQPTLGIAVIYIHIIYTYFKTALHWIVWLEIERQTSISNRQPCTDVDGKPSENTDSCLNPLVKPVVLQVDSCDRVCGLVSSKRVSKLYFSQTKLVELMERLESDSNRMGPHRLLHCAVASCDVSMMYGAPYAQATRAHKPSLTWITVESPFHLMISRSSAGCYYPESISTSGH